jgi:hypothetical protein
MIPGGVKSRRRYKAATERLPQPFRVATRCGPFDYRVGDRPDKLRAARYDSAMENPLVFISHIKEERAIAAALKTLIETHFLETIEVFVSSEPESIPLGQTWLESITVALKRCEVGIIIASPQSVTRPWINFEAGAIWLREKPVIPLCHSGMTLTLLPQPLANRQAAMAMDESQLRSLIPVLARIRKSSAPTIDFRPFIQAVADYELLGKQREELLEHAPFPMTNGLAAHEVATLIALADEIDSPISAVAVHRIRENMQASGYRNAATNLAFRLLEQRGMIRLEELETDYDQTISMVSFASAGWDWLKANQETLVLKRESSPPSPSGPPADDIPF